MKIQKKTLFRLCQFLLCSAIVASTCFAAYWLSRGEWLMALLLAYIVLDAVRMLHKCRVPGTGYVEWRGNKGTSAK